MIAPRSLRFDRRAIKRLCTALSIAIVIIIAPDCQAQLFGEARQLGSPIQRRQQPSRAEQAASEAGQVQGNERFLRNNRRRGDFVGSDRFERRSFVGSQQGTASGRAIPSTVGVRPRRDRSQQINQPLPAPAKGQPYYPKLELGFTAEPSGIRFGRELQRELENPDYFSTTNRYEVLVEARTAILRGVVADARERDLAELMVSFEPGISSILNELQIARGSRSNPELLPETPRSAEPQTEPEPESASEQKSATPADLEVPPALPVPAVPNRP